MLKEFRCSNCNKLLGMIEGKAEIVCTRCKVLNAFDVPLHLQQFLESEEVKLQYEMFIHMNQRP